MGIFNKITKYEATLWYNSLPVANYDEISTYFDFEWKKPASYYNASLVYATIFQMINSLSFDYSLVKMLPDLTPIVRVKENRFVLIAPKSNNIVIDMYSFIVNELACELILYAPNLDPENFFRIYQVRPQVVYNTEYITQKIEEELHFNNSQILTKRMRVTLKKNIRECIFRPVVENDSVFIESVLRLWENGPAGQNKRIVRLVKDMATIDWATNPETYGIYAFLGFRDNFPISYTFLAPLPGFPEMVTQVVSKSLNYKSLPGGYNNTSVWELYESAKWCFNNNIKYINSSGTPYNTTHREFKTRFSLIEDDFTVNHWIATP